MRLPGERSIYDLNEESEAKLAKTRAERMKNMNPPELRAAIRTAAGIRALDHLPMPLADAGAAETDPGGTITSFTLRPEPGIWLPARLYRPTQPSGRTLLLLDDGGKDAVPGEAARRMAAGDSVLAVDLRGTGSTRAVGQDKFGDDVGTDWEDFYRAFVLGRSHVAMRAEDILVCARWAARQCGSEQVEVHASGGSGIAALHAAALEPALIARLELRRTLASWRLTVRQRPTRNQLIHTVHGALRVYDLPDLVWLLGDRVKVDEPVDAQGNPVGEHAAQHHGK
jgi:hypothetical protein